MYYFQWRVNLPLVGHTIYGTREKKDTVQKNIPECNRSPHKAEEYGSILWLVDIYKITAVTLQTLQSFTELQYKGVCTGNIVFCLT